MTLLDRIFGYQHMPTQMSSKPDVHQLGLEQVRGEVTFKNVTFIDRHDEDSTLTSINEGGMQGKTKPPVAQGELLPTLRNISFTIKPEKMAVLVGYGGVGKTMITSLLSHPYNIESGVIEIDGINVKDMPQTSLDKLIGVVRPEARLFYASIRENILYGCPGATEEEMMVAAQAVNIHDRILQLKEGYDTILRKRGDQLTEGEKWLIAIARVMLKNPRILIVNEATHTLDADAKRLVYAALDTLMKGRTILNIAHRFSTILAANEILVINKGEIVERGTHQELLWKGGLYAERYYERYLQRLEARTGLGKRPLTQQTTVEKVPAPFMKTQTPGTHQMPLIQRPSIQQTTVEKVPIAVPVFSPNTEPATHAQYCLFIFSDITNEIRELALERDIIRLGQADTNDVVFDKHSTTSPYHALLRKKGEDYYLFEQYTDKGVFVNGQKLGSSAGHKLTHGDQIMIGQYRLIFSNYKVSQ